MSIFFHHLRMSLRGMKCRSNRFFTNVTRLLRASALAMTHNIALAMTHNITLAMTHKEEAL